MSYSYSIGNPVEIIMHFFQIGEMICLDYLDEFPMVSVLMCMVKVTYDARLPIITIHQTTILHRLLTLRGY